MTSRFVSGGTIAGDGVQGETGELRGESGRVEGKRDGGTVKWGDEGRRGGGSGGGSKTSVEWEAVQKDLDEERRRRVEARKAAAEGGEKSLYDILQANKAAKQAAFEEQNRIRNQFRALDDDEIEFLHGVSDEKRAEEERVKRETEDRLASFRKAQQLSGGGGGGGDDGSDVAGVNDDEDPGVNEEWTAATGRKRKREREKAGLKGIRRKTAVSDGGEKEEVGSGKKGAEGVASGTPALAVSESNHPDPSGGKSKTAPSPISKPNVALGLVDYGSDEDDEDD